MIEMKTSQNDHRNLFELHDKMKKIRKKNGAHKHCSLFSDNFASKYSRHVVLCNYNNRQNNIGPILVMIEKTSQKEFDYINHNMQLRFFEQRSF